MICQRCSKPLKRMPAVDPGRYLVVSMLSHADVEDIAHGCPRCAKILCGSCCLPRWEAMKKQRGMNGHELAAVLDSHPEIVYDEQPTCPDCAVAVQAKSAGEPVPARRSGSTMAFNLAIAAGAGAGAAALFANEHPVWGGLVSVVAVGMFFAAFFMSFAAGCPFCGAALAALHAGINGPCGSCYRYLRLRDGLLAPLEEDCVQSIPSFGLPVDAVTQLPLLCAGCGQEAARTELVASTSWPGLSLSASVPHCGACRGGAAYGSTSLLTASATETKSSICLQVKSHRFYHAAMTANSAAYRAAR